MRRSWLLLGLAAMGCVDLTRPPQLSGSPPDQLPPDAAATTDSASVSPDADLSPPADGGAPADMAVPIDADLADVGATVPADAASPDVAIDLAADAPAAPEVPPHPDAALAADLAPDSALAVDLARDVGPDAGVDLASDLAPDLARDLAPDLAPPDAGPPPLVIDNFQGPSVAINTLNSEVTWDNETCSRVNGESVCSYTGSGGFHDFIESLNSFCEFDARAYTKISLRLRTSVAGEQVQVIAGMDSAAGCPRTQTNMPLGTITTTTTMTTYTFVIPTLAAAKLLVYIELDPQSTTTTQFILDDFQLVP
jgi:hypothetical protein